MLLFEEDKVLLFLGNIAPDSSSTISFSEVYIYEGEFGAKSELQLNELINVNVPTPSNGEILTWDNANSQWIAGAGASAAVSNASIEALNKKSSKQENRFNDLKSLLNEASSFTENISQNTSQQ